MKMWAPLILGTERTEFPPNPENGRLEFVNDAMYIYVSDKASWMQLTNTDIYEVTPILSITNTPPATPADGDKYVVGGIPTGVWVGHEQSVASYSSSTSSWTFKPAYKYQQVINISTKEFYIYNGTSWDLISSYTLPQASASTLGGIKVGSGLSIDSNTGILSSNTTNVLPNGTKQGSLLYYNLAASAWAQAPNALYGVNGCSVQIGDGTTTNQKFMSYDIGSGTNNPYMGWYNGIFGYSGINSLLLTDPSTSRALGLWSQSAGSTYSGCGTTSATAESQMFIYRNTDPSTNTNLRGLIVGLNFNSSNPYLGGQWANSYSQGVTFILASDRIATISFNEDYRSTDIAFRKVTSGNAYLYTSATDVHTFSSLPFGPSLTPSSNYQFANKIYVDGAITAAAYVLPTATAAILGGVKIGSRITITSGVISADVQSTNDYTSAEKTKLAGIATGANLYVLPVATTLVVGGVKQGSNVTIAGDGTLTANVQSTNDYTSAEKTKLAGIATGANLYVLPVATSSVVGGVKQGSNVTIAADGTLTANVQSTNDYTSAEKTKLAGLSNYTLPIATSSVVGGVKQGSNVTIAGDGTITANDQLQGNFWTKTELAATGGANAKVDWSQIKNIPSLGSNKWLEPVANTAARTALTGLVAGDMVLVIDDGDGKAAQYAYNGTAWVKIADVDWTPYSHPNDGGGDMTSALTGANVVSQIRVNTLGHTTAITTRAITLADLGYTAYTLPTATAAVLGGVKIGSRITITSGVISADVQSTNDYTTIEKTKLAGIADGANLYVLPIATSSVVGGVKQGSNVAIAADGTISVSSPYTLPVATASVVGGVKQGSNVTIAGDGTLTANVQSTNDYTTTEKTKLAGLSNYTLPLATTTVVGGVKQGSNVTVAVDGTLTANVQSTNDYTSAEKTKLAGIATGANLYVLPVATTSVVGGVKQGSNVTIAGDGTLTANVQSTNDYTSAEKTKLAGIATGANLYVLPVATNLVVGGVKQGSNVTIAGDGTLTANDQLQGNFWTKTELAATGGTNAKVDWSQIKNIPSLGSNKWLEPVANTAARTALTGLVAGDMVLVIDDGDGKAAQYAYNGTAWVKIADVDWTPYTHPIDGGGDMTSALTGANVVSQIRVNTLGHTTSITTRAITLADLGYTAYTLPTATAAILGGVKIGSRITIASGVISADVQSTNDYTTTEKTKLAGIADGANLYVLPVATTSVVGGVKQGSNVTIAGDGTLTANVQSTNDYTTVEKTKLAGLSNYTLPIATASVVGGVKQGSNVTIAGDGTLTANVQSTNDYTTVEKTKLAGIATGANLYVLPVATTSVVGGVKQGSNVTIAGDGTLTANVQSTNDYTSAEKTKLAGIAVGANLYVLPVATSSVVGGVKQGSNVTIAGDGTISVSAPYTLPVATTSVVGGVKQGSNVSIAADGTLTANDQLQGNFWTKTELAATGGSNAKVDWSQIKNIPSLGSNKWLEPVANTAARTALTGLVSGDMVLVIDDGDGKAAQYAYNGTAWVKIADVDWTPYTHPNDGGGDMTSALTGANVVSQIRVNALGHTTAIATRAITLTDLGYTAYTLPTATAAILGGVKIGSRITIASGVISADVQSTNDYTSAEKTKLAGLSNYTLPLATTSVVGGVKQGSNVTIAGDGTLTANVQSTNDYTSAEKTKLAGLSNYTLPVATTSVVGGVKQGSNVTIAGDGTLTANVQSTNDYTTIEKTKLAGIATGANLYVLPNATTTSVGGVQIGWGFTYNSTTGVLDANPSATNPTRVILTDVKASGTNGGTFTLGAWRTRDLNTIEMNAAWLVSLSANRFTLSSGNYMIEAFVPAYKVTSHMARFQSITGDSISILGTSEYSGNSANCGQTHSIIAADFSLTQNTVFEIQHYSKGTTSNQGFGLPVAITGITEKYTIVKVTRLY